jgi:hypothetical protein
MMDLFNILVSSILVGLIWVVQLILYPAFLFIDDASFGKFHDFHTRNIGLIVVPLMLSELILGFYLLLLKGTSNLPYILNMGLVCIIWLSTFYIQVPLHRKLRSKNKVVINKLIKSNWIRTIAWSTKIVILLLNEYGKDIYYIR